MNTKDYQVFSHFASLVQQRFPEARVWAFGSRVNGTATEESDLDVCVVVKTVNDPIKKKIREIAWQVGFDAEVILSTVIYSTDAFERGPCSVSSLVKSILAGGVMA
jgi:predicted nucleotidyltransferase